MTWTTPADIAAKLRRRWDDGSLLRAYAAREPFPRVEVPLRGPRASEIGHRLDDHRTEIATELVAALAADAEDLDRLAFRDERADPATRLAHDRAVEAAAQAAIARGDEGLTGKPTPAIFLAAAQRVGIAPEHCIVFEDAPFGIEAARRAGMRAVGICTTNTPEELAGPHVITCVRDYNELLQSNFLENLHVAHA